MNLAETQHRFADHLLHRETDLSALNVSGPFAPEQLLQLYRNNFYISLTEYLQACYPVALALVGEEFFAQLAKAFIRLQPLEEASLERYGSRFPAFVAACEQARQVPYLADIVQLEWLLETAKACTDQAPFPFEALSRLTPEQQSLLAFDLADGIGLIESDFPIFSIWQGVSSGNLDTIDMSHAEQLLVRPTQPGAAELISISPQHYRLLEGCRTGTALTAMELPDDFQQQLEAWISQGIINNYHLVQPES